MSMLGKLKKWKAVKHQNDTFYVMTASLARKMADAFDAFTQGDYSSWSEMLSDVEEEMVTVHVAENITYKGDATKGKIQSCTQGKEEQVSLSGFLQENHFR